MGRRARDPTRLARQTSLPKEVPDPEQAHDRRFPAMRHHRQLDAARLHEEHRIGGGALREDALALTALHEGSPRADLREKHLHVKTGRALRGHDASLTRVFQAGKPGSCLAPRLFRRQARASGHPHVPRAGRVPPRPRRRGPVLSMYRTILGSGMVAPCPARDTLHRTAIRRRVRGGAGRASSCVLY
jgi:hypothetical protein